MQLTRDRIALDAQLEVVLFLAAFGLQGDLIKVNPRLRNTIHAQVHVSGDLVGGFYIAIDAHAGDGEFLPAQAVSGDVSQKLRGLDRAAHFHQPFRRSAQPRQSIIKIRRIDGGIQIQIFHPQLALDVGGIAAQRHVQAGNDPLQVAVALQRAMHIHLVLLHVAGNFQLRHIHLPAAAVQTAAGFNQAVELRWPVRHLFGSVDTVKRQFAAPADRLLPVEQRRQFGFALQRRDRQLIEVNLLFVALRIKGNARRR